MSTSKWFLPWVAGVLLIAACCGGEPETSPPDGAVRLLERFPLDSLAGVITRDVVTLDPDVTVDDHGSLRVDALGPITVRLFEVRGITVEEALLFYEARLKTEGLAGQTFLEMWCHFPGQGEFFSRTLDQALSGTNDWTTQVAPFRLEQGQRPDYLRLNLVTTGPGRVWVDDLSVWMGPLPSLSASPAK